MTEKELRQNIQNKKNKLNQKRRGILFYEILEEILKNEWIEKIEKETSFKKELKQDVKHIKNKLEQKIKEHIILFDEILEDKKRLEIVEELKNKRIQKNND